LSFKYGNSLFCHNVRINGMKAIFFAFGLSSWRYIEYGFVLDSLQDIISPLMNRHNKFVLDVGSGYSILPSFLKMIGFQVCAVEISKMALKFQHDRGVQVVRASGEKLPFRPKVCDVVMSISVIEHIPGDGDIAAVVEMSKQLKDGGLMIISLPFGEKSKVETDFLWGIPSIFRRVLKIIGSTRFIFEVFRLFRIERGEVVLNRVYDSQEINNRIIKSSEGMVKSRLYISGSKWSQIAYKIMPMTLLSCVEYQLAKSLKVEQKFQAGLSVQDRAIILKFVSARNLNGRV